MARRALLIGINDYGGNGDLRGCENDVTNMRSILKTYFGFENSDIRVVLNKRATKDNILTRLKKMVAASKAKDTLFVHFSGHGSQIRDRDGDDLKDNMDELICPHDMDWDGSFITDDDLNKIFGKLNPEAHLEVVMDCCHSGTLLRNPDFGRPAELGPEHPTLPRRLIPPVDIQCRVDGEEDALEKPRFMRLTKGSSKRILWAGCMDWQSSADAYIEGKGSYNGAFTYYLCDHIRKMDGNITRIELVKRVQQTLKHKRFDQIPQLEFDATNKKAEQTRLLE